MTEKEKIFDSESQLIDAEIQNIDNLYDEIKNHFDGVKNSRSAGTLTFIEKQTTNLINLKNAKLNMLREKINIKKIASDLEYKDKQLEAKEKENSSAELPPEIYNQLQNLINSNKAEIPGPYDHDPLMDRANERMNEEIDDILDKALEGDTSPLLNLPKKVSTINVNNSNNLYSNDLGVIWTKDELGELKYVKELKNFDVDKDLNMVHDLNEDIFYNLIDYKI